MDQIKIKQWIKTKSRSQFWDFDEEFQGKFCDFQELKKNNSVKLKEIFVVAKKHWKNDDF